MDFMTAVKTCLGQYATFKGRAIRSEYWFFTLFTVLVQLVCGVIDAALPTDVPVFQSIATLIFLLPGLAVSFRRLHDLDKSGWWFLIVLIPVIGVILLLVWFCKSGTAGANRFGDNPLATPSAVAEAA